MVYLSDDANWHVQRRIKLIRKYPEIIKYSKPFYLSLLIIFFLVILQLGLGYIIQIYNISFLFIGLISFINANSLYHSLASFIHENSHGLVLGLYKRDFVSFILELGLTSFGEHHNYEITHQRNHHISLNVKNIDSECTNKGHMTNLTRISNNQILNRFIYLFDLLPLGSIIIQEIGKINLSKKDKEEIKELKSYFNIKKKDRHLKLLMATFTSLSIGYLLYHQWYKFVLFKIWSLSIYQGKFSIFRRGQSISEHYSDIDNLKNPTQSTYGLIENLFGFNTGYHDEHHTFPTIPWVYLPRIKKIAPEHFTSINKRSYFSLWYQWLKSDFKNTFYRSCEVKNN